MTSIEGKGKRVISEDGAFVLEYVDTVTGHAPGQPDPGGNQVIGSEPGSGERALRITLRVWQALREAGIPVIPATSLDERRVRVPAVELIPIEVIVRNRATGSFLRRYGRFTTEGASLDGLIELTLKDDALGDPVIVDEAVRMLHLASSGELSEMRRLAARVNYVLRDLFAGSGIELWDFKVEFARHRGALVVRDELSPRTARFRAADGRLVSDDAILAVLTEGVAERSPELALSE